MPIPQINDLRKEYYGISNCTEEYELLDSKTLLGAKRLIKKLFREDRELWILEKTVRYAGLGAWKTIKRTYYSSSHIQLMTTNFWTKWQIKNITG